MVIDESPLSLSSLAVMQMDDHLHVHLKMYISMFKQRRHVKKYTKYPVGFTTECLPLDVMVTHKFG